MQINVAQLLKESTGAERHHNIDEDFAPEEVSTLVEASAFADVSTDVGSSALAEGSTPVEGSTAVGGPEGRVRGKVSLTRAARGVLLRGSFNCEVRLTCGRCLAPFSHSASFDCEEMFYPLLDILTGLPLTLPEEDMSSSFTIDEHHVLDTTEMIRQYCLLAIPMKPLCRTDCAGLCPECGANLNESRCHCTPGPRTALAEALERARAADRTEALDRSEPGRSKSRRKLG